MLIEMSCQLAARSPNEMGSRTQYTLLRYHCERWVRPTRKLR